MNPFVQSPCPRCGTSVWIPTATGMAYCPQCQTPVSQQPGAQAAPAQPAAPAQSPPGFAATVAIPSMATPPGGSSGWGSPPSAVPSQGTPQGGAQPFGGGFQPGFGAPQQPPATPAGNPFGGAPQAPNSAFGAPQGQGGFGAPQGQGASGAPQGQGAYGAPQGQGAYGAPPAQAGYGVQAGFPQAAYQAPAAASRGGMLKMILPAIGAIALACVAALARSGVRNFARPGHRSLSSYNIEERSADPDAMIRAAGELARNWRNDAVFSSININGMSPSGTVDLSNSSHTVTVEYFSPSRVSSYIERDRRDSIKKFTFTSSGIDYNTVWGVRQRVDHPTPTPTPACNTRQLGTILTSQGVPASADLHVQYDPQFAFAVNGALAWHVMSSSPTMDRWFDVGACTFLRGN